MTNSTIQPGMRAALVPASPYTPIAVINGTPIYAMRGGRSGGGIAIVAGDADGDDDDDLLDDADDGGDADDEDDELPASMRGKRTAKKATRRAAVEDDGDDEPDDEDDDDEVAGSVRRMEEALAKANKTAGRYRRAGKAMERLGIDDLPTYLTSIGVDPDTGRPFGSDVVDPEDEGTDGDDSDVDLYADEERRDRRPSRADEAKRDRDTVRAIRTAEKRAEAKVRSELIPVLAQQAATMALRAAGFKGSDVKMEKILRLIDPDSLDIILTPDEFEIEGLDEQIAELRDELPELFAAPTESRSTRTGGTRTRPAARRTSGASDVDGGGRGRPAKKPGGWMDQVAARWDRDGR